MSVGCKGCSRVVDSREEDGKVVRRGISAQRCALADCQGFPDRSGRDQDGRLLSSQACGGRIRNTVEIVMIASGIYGPAR